MEDYIKEIIEHNPSLRAGEINEIKGGVVGLVYRISNNETPPLIIKFNKEKSSYIKNSDEEVYGSNPDDFNKSYEILKKNGIPVPEVFVLGITNDKKFRYIVMRELEGDNDDYSELWFKEVGQWLGKIHAIKKTYESSWVDRFKESLQSRLNNLKGLLEKDTFERVESYILNHINSLTSIENFCFSHLDGFQGIMKKRNNSWELLGVIDIEDHQYTDQRFVLAGFELNNDMKGNIIPPIFWDEYHQSKNIDSTYEKTKNIFKVYYLLVWCYVFRSDKEHFCENVSFLKDIVREG